MTTVANMPVGADATSGTVGKGAKSRVGDRASFLGGPVPTSVIGGVASAIGNRGVSPGPGGGELPKVSARPLTGVEKSLKDQGV